jgi:hypothetical protein
MVHFAGERKAAAKACERQRMSKSPRHYGVSICAVLIREYSACGGGNNDCQLGDMIR